MAHSNENSGAGPSDHYIKCPEELHFTSKENKTNIPKVHDFTNINQLRAQQSSKSTCASEAQSAASGLSINVETYRDALTLGLSHPEDVYTSPNRSEVLQIETSIINDEDSIHSLHLDRHMKANDDTKKWSWMQTFTNILPEGIKNSIMALSAMNIYFEIQTALEKLHKRDRKRTYQIPWDRSLIFQENFFDLAVTTRNPVTRSITESKCCNMKEIFTSCPPVKYIAILGRPGFGKSTLLEHIALEWAMLDETRFGLCLKFQLEGIKMDLLEDTIITSCRKLLSKSASYDSNIIKSALKYRSESSLLLFDGYDKLLEHDKETFYRFLRMNMIFINSTIVICSRYGLHKNISEMIDRYVNINGLSIERLVELHKFVIYKYPETPISEFNNFVLRLVKIESINYLSEVCPFLQYYVCLAIVEKRLQMKNMTIFDVLKYTLKTFAFDEYERFQIINSTDVIIMFFQLGRLFYKALVDNNFVFEKRLLLKSVEERSFDFAVQIGLLHIQPSSKDDSILLTISSKLLMVFFITYYLRAKWRHLKRDKERTNFLKTFLCLGDSFGDYVVTNSSLNFVGVLPELVLHFGNQCTLAKADIKMYYDTERIEYSHAFDSVNLLVRINESSLSRFQFAKITTERQPLEVKKLEQIFRVYLNTLSFDEFNVKHAFYNNTYEKKRFLKVDIETSNPRKSVALAVLRTNVKSEIEKGYIEILSSELVAVFSFLSVFLSSNIPGVSLDGKCKTFPFHMFLNTLICTICQSNTKKEVLIHCGNRTESKPWKLKRTVWSILIKPKSNTETSGVCIMHDDFHPRECLVTNKFFDRDWLLSHSIEFLKIIKSNCEMICNPTLRLYFF